MNGARSYWTESAPDGAFPSLSEDRQFEVVVIGGGIAGAATALALARDVASVALLEARRLGSGVTGYTTGKVSALHATRLQKIEKALGRDTVRAYAEANQYGVEETVRLVEELGIDCDLRRKANYTYAAKPAGRKRIEKEAALAADLGLPARFVGKLADLPVPHSGAVMVEDQAEVHAVRFVQGLAEAFVAAGGEVFERTRAVSVGNGSPATIETAAGSAIRADEVVVATHMPFLDRGLYFARMEQERSYALLARVGGELPGGMYLSDESPAHSLRTVPVDGGEALLIAGEGHAIGDADPADRYAALRQWAEQHFDVESVDYHWAAHDQMSADHAPYVGRLWPLSDRIWTATGFSKWGLAMGVASGRMLADAIAGRDAPWLEALSSTRFTPLASARTATEANAKTGARFFVDRIRRRASAKRLGAGEGAVVGAGLGQRAVYRDEDGHEHSLSARCTHLGCIVSFNSAEKTWDCACHGSRFGIDGEVLQGPAVEPLRREEEEGA